MFISLRSVRSRQVKQIRCLIHIKIPVNENQYDFIIAAAIFVGGSAFVQQDVGERFKEEKRCTIVLSELSFGKWRRNTWCKSSCLPKQII